MCLFLNEPNSTVEFLQTVVEMKDQRIEELENLVDELKRDIHRLEEIEWMYNELLD